MKRGIRNTVNRIAQVIRQRGILDRDDFVILCNLGPSTFYNYRGLICKLNPDIIYEDGMYKTVKIEQVS